MPPHSADDAHQQLPLGRAERSSPAPAVDACRRHQPPGRCCADARQRSQQRLRAHPACRLVVPCQGLRQGQLACLQPRPEPLPLGSHLQGPEAGSLALFMREPRRYRLRPLRSVRSRGAASPGSRPCWLCTASYGLSSYLGGRTSVTGIPRVLPCVRWQLCSESLHDAGSGSPGGPQHRGFSHPDPADLRRSRRIRDTYRLLGCPGKGCESSCLGAQAGGSGICSSLPAIPVSSPWHRSCVPLHPPPVATTMRRPSVRPGDLLQPGRYVPCISALVQGAAWSKMLRIPRRAVPRSRPCSPSASHSAGRLCCIRRRRPVTQYLRGWKM